MAKAVSFWVGSENPAVCDGQDPLSVGFPHLLPMLRDELQRFDHRRWKAVDIQRKSEHDQLGAVGCRKQPRDPVS